MKNDMLSSKTRIHILVNCFWKSGMSGGDRRVIEIAKCWNIIPEIDISVYAPKSFTSIVEKEIPGIKTFVTDVDLEEDAGILKAYYKRTKNLVHILKKSVSNGDVIYSSSDIMPDVIPALYCKKHLGAKWVLLTHHINEKFYKRPGNIASNFISCMQQVWGISRGAKYADLYFVISPQVMEEFRRRKYDLNKIHRVDNAVDLELIDSSKEEVASYEATFMARLNPSKGVMELPTIWRRVVDTIPKARLAIIGKGNAEMVGNLRNEIARLGLDDSIDLFGFVESKKGYSLIKNSKCFLFTSHEEGWGIAVAEALACSTPVVAYNLPVFSVLFPKGVLMNTLGDINNMAQDVLDLLKDDKRRSVLGEEGNGYIRSHYSWGYIAKEEIEYINSL